MPLSECPSRWEKRPQAVKHPKISITSPRRLNSPRQWLPAQLNDPQNRFTVLRSMLCHWSPMVAAVPFAIGLAATPFDENIAVPIFRRRDLC